VASGGWLLYSLRSQASAIIEQLPTAARRLRQTLERDRPTAATAIEQVQKAASEIERATSAAAPPPPPSGVQRVQVESAPINISDYVMWGSLGIVAALGQFVLILFLVYFLLVSGDLYRRKLVKIIGTTLSEKKVTVQILQEIDRQISMFLLVQVFTSTLVAIATWLALRRNGGRLWPRRASSRNRRTIRIRRSSRRRTPTFRRLKKRSRRSAAMLPLPKRISLAFRMFRATVSLRRRSMA